MWLLDWVLSMRRWACALCNACSRVVVSCFALYDGSARKASGHTVLVNGIDPKTASLGSWDMYFIARSGRVRGFQCINLLILKQLHSASYKESGMGNGSSCSSCWVCFCFLCSLRSFVKVSL